MKLAQLRQQYHSQICSEIIRITKDKANEYPNFADGTNRGSVSIAQSITRQFGCPPNFQTLKGQVVGNRFEEITRDFLAHAFNAIHHLRPGRWLYKTEQTAISGFDQYEHLAYLNSVIGEDKSLAAALGGDYIVKPDIVIGRYPVSEEEINAEDEIVSSENQVANLSPLRLSNQPNPRPILHASISCKWTIRSDRSQNTRTEALNLIRNRKGKLPHIVAVTAEPLPTRIAALALGTGDLDCVYHFALYELQRALKETGNEDQQDMLNILLEGRRLRDISDLPFDLAT